MSVQTPSNWPEEVRLKDIAKPATQEVYEEVYFEVQTVKALVDKCWDYATALNNHGYDQNRIHRWGWKIRNYKENLQRALNSELTIVTEYLDDAITEWKERAQFLEDLLREEDPDVLQQMFKIRIYSLLGRIGNHPSLTRPEKIADKAKRRADAMIRPKRKPGLDFNNVQIDRLSWSHFTVPLGTVDGLENGKRYYVWENSTGRKRLGVVLVVRASDSEAEVEARTSFMTPTNPDDLAGSGRVLSTDRESHPFLPERTFQVWDEHEKKAYDNIRYEKPALIKKYGVPAEEVRNKWRLHEKKVVSIGGLARTMHAGDDAKNFLEQTVSKSGKMMMHIGSDVDLTAMEYPDLKSMKMKSVGITKEQYLQHVDTIKITALSTQKLQKTPWLLEVDHIIGDPRLLVSEAVRMRWKTITLLPNMSSGMVTNVIYSIPRGWKGTLIVPDDNRTIESLARAWNIGHINDYYMKGSRLDLQIMQEEMSVSEATGSVTDRDPREPKLFEIKVEDGKEVHVGDTVRVWGDRDFLHNRKWETLEDIYIATATVIEVRGDYAIAEIPRLGRYSGNKVAKKGDRFEVDNNIY